MDYGLIKDIFCIYCGAGAQAAWPGGGMSSPSTSHHVCRACGGLHDIVNGVPWFGVYMAEDVAELLRTFPDTTDAGIPSAVEASASAAVCKRWHEQGLGAAAGDAKARATVDSWYRDWFQLDAMVGPRSLAQANVLVLGADCTLEIARLLESGAAVTCLEACLPKLEAGRRTRPSVRWIGGPFTNLPFEAETFDYVVVNARRVALQAFSATFSELARVAKVGGEVFVLRLPTAPGQGWEDPATETLFATMEGGRLRPVEPAGRVRHILAQAAGELHLALLLSPTLPSTGEAERLENAEPDHWRSFDAAALEHLETRAGSLGIAGRKKGLGGRSPVRQSAHGLPPLTAAACLADTSGGLRRLLAWAPRTLIDRPLLAETTWMDIHLGWGEVDEPSQSRLAYGRGRWLLKPRTSGRWRLSFSICRNDAAPRSLAVKADGVVIATCQVDAEWREVTVEMPPTPFPGEVLLVELGWNDLDDGPPRGNFQIRDRRYGA